MTLGFDVFVQLVIAATDDGAVIEPLEAWANLLRLSRRPQATAQRPVHRTRPACRPGFVVALDFRSASMVSSACSNLNFAWRSDTRSCGRFGPARLGSTVDRSSSIDVV